MTSTQILLLVLMAIVLVAAAFVVALAARRVALRRWFGPEYDQVAAEQDSRLAADRELANRRRRHHALQLRTIEPEARERYLQRWRAVQAQFVDDPNGAVVAGDELVTRLVRDRGYPTDDYDDQLSLLSVEHARTLNHYRNAHDIVERARRGQASTEDLRRALVSFRALFADVLGEHTGDSEPPTVPLHQPARRDTWAAADMDSAQRPDRRGIHGNADRHGNAELHGAAELHDDEVRKP